MTLERFMNGVSCEPVINVLEKRCPKCGETKPLSEYHKHKSMFMGVQGHCKTCRTKGGKGYSSAANALMKKLGMKRPPLGTPCDNCGDTTKKLFFDHCHVTLTFRGWLCQSCNFRIGTMGDVAEKITENYKMIMRYLKCTN